MHGTDVQMSSDRCTEQNVPDEASKHKSLQMTVQRLRSLRSDQKALGEELKQGEDSIVGGPNG